jgi:hypothetical protein
MRHGISSVIFFRGLHIILFHFALNFNRLLIFLTTASRLALGPTRPPIQWVPGDLSLGVNRPGRERDYSPPSNAEVKECVEVYLYSPNTPWHGAQFKKSTGTTLTLPLSLILSIFCIMLTRCLMCSFCCEWGYIQKFPDWVDNEIYAYNNKQSMRSNTKGYGGKTHQTDPQNSDTTALNVRELYHLQLSLRNLLDTPSFVSMISFQTSKSSLNHFSMERPLVDKVFWVHHLELSYWSSCDGDVYHDTQITSDSYSVIPALLLLCCVLLHNTPSSSRLVSKLAINFLYPLFFYCKVLFSKLLFLLFLNIKIYDQERQKRMKLENENENINIVAKT